MTGAELFAKLSAPFDPKVVSWRVSHTTADKSKAMCLCYIDSRDVQDRFNEVCGPFGWQSEHNVSHDSKMVTCRIGVKDPDTGAWIWRSDGAGHTDVEGEKGSYSDSLKRAAVSFGVGRYLYDAPSPWVEVEPAGKSVKIKESERPKLIAALSKLGQATVAKSTPASTNPPPAKPLASEAPKPSGDFVEDDEPVCIPTEGKSTGKWGKELIDKFKAAPDMATLMAWKEKNRKVIDQLGPKAQKSVEDAYAAQHEAIVSA